MESLYDFDELDEYIDDHCGLFVDYIGGAEQRLEWGCCHLEYVRLVEARIAQYLALLGATSDQLYEMLAEVAAGDERAVAFLDRLLGMGDYAHFAQSMRAGRQSAEGERPRPRAAHRRPARRHGTVRIA